MEGVDAVMPVEVSLIIEGGRDEGSLKSILEISDKLREEYGLAVRVDMVSSVVMEPLAGWIHTLSYPLDPLRLDGAQEEEGYIILKDGSHVRVIITGACTEESLEKALVEAALQALARGNNGFESPDGSSDKLRSDPGSFASGEYIAFSAA
jgi:hypothetical protein